MKLLAFIALLAVICTRSEAESLFESLPAAFGFGNITPMQPCEQDPIPLFRDALNDFAIRLTKRASYYSNDHFVISPNSIWLSLASLAEFAAQSVQKDLFTALNLPEERCIRVKFYSLALNLESPGPDVRFERRRALAINQDIELNNDWIKFSDSSNILKYMSVQFNDANFTHTVENMGLPEKLVLSGHSILLDRLYYEGLWTSAFINGTIVQGPFFNELGQRLASVEYMMMTSRVRLAHVPTINAKVLELPVGTEGRYTMLFILGIHITTIKSIMDLLKNSLIVDIMSALILSPVPITVAIPRFSMSNGYDAKPMLSDMGLSKMFTDPAATSFVSDPPATPCGYLQRVSINITTATLGANSQGSLDALSGFFDMASNVTNRLAPAVGRDFVAYRPFLFTLIDTKTRIPIFTGVYSDPEGQTQRHVFGHI